MAGVQAFNVGGLPLSLSQDVEDDELEYEEDGGDDEGMGSSSTGARPRIVTGKPL